MIAHLSHFPRFQGRQSNFVHLLVIQNDVSGVRSSLDDDCTDPNWIWRYMRKWSARSLFFPSLCRSLKIFIRSLIPFQLFFVIIFSILYSSSSYFFFLSNFSNSSPLTFPLPFSLPLDGIMSAPARVFVYFPAETREAEGLQSVRMMEQQKTRRSNGNI